MGGSLGPRARLDPLDKIKISCSYLDSNNGQSSYTDYATPATL